MHLVLQRSLGSAAFSPVSSSELDPPPAVRADSRVLPLGIVPADISLSGPVLVAAISPTPTLLESDAPMERGRSKATTPC